MKLGDIVKIKPEFCDIGESECTYEIVKLNKVTAEILDIDHYIPFSIKINMLIQGDTK
jgi:hypothetical protein